MKLHTAAPAALVLSAALVLTGCSSGPPDPGSSHGSNHGTAERAADANDADVMFAQMMVAHHEQAIEMSDIVLAKGGVDQRVVSLAEAIKQAQGPEIAQMQGWLEDWGADRSTDGMHHGGTGMMSHDDLTKLEQADGRGASRLFLTQMIAHHEGAIDMARDQVDAGRDAEAVELARSVISAQTTEIQQMRDLREDL